jgi:hypothetical protein
MQPELIVSAIVIVVLLLVIIHQSKTINRARNRASFASMYLRDALSLLGELYVSPCCEIDDNKRIRNLVIKYRDLQSLTYSIEESGKNLIRTIDILLRS